MEGGLADELFDATVERWSTPQPPVPAKQGESVIEILGTLLASFRLSPDGEELLQDGR